MSILQSRLEKYLHRKNNRLAFEPLTPDASNREYYRIAWNDETAVACVYPDPFAAVEQSYLDVTNLFRRCGLPVAEIIDFDETLGVIVMADMGDTILRNALEKCSSAERDRLINQAVALIARIQAATEEAYALDSIASRLKFDVEKLNWELQYFKTHYFTTLRNAALKGVISAEMDAEFIALAGELEERAAVLCHRDYHAANLMIDRRGGLRIIDHQDARIGPVTYDLVSLLLDRVTEIPSATYVLEKQELFLSERNRLGLLRVEFADFAEEFRLQTIQRCLKAAGTFSYQAAARGHSRYLQFIGPMFRITLAAINDLGRFPVIGSVIKTEISRHQE